MSQPMSSAKPPFNAAQSARAAFSDLDLHQLAIFAGQSPTRRIEMMFDLCRFAQRMVIAAERQRDPDVTDSELARRVRQRIELTYGA